MRRRLHKLLLILVTLSVACAPLRIALALPDAAATDTDTESHCAGMQHDMQQMKHDADPGGDTGNSDHKCKSGCNGSCCDKSCSACLHATAAIPTSLIVLRDTPDHEHGLTVAGRFPERHLKPPLRPPLALQ